MGEEEMKFFNKELCEKLQKVGCLSKIDFIFQEPTDEFPFGAYYRKVFPYSSKYTGCVYAFSIYDFGPYWGDESMIDYERKTIACSDNQEDSIEKSVDWVLNNNIE